MKHQQPTAAQTIAQPRTASDNLCKLLAEQYPLEFARWAFGVTGSIKVDKTELSREPIRADAVIFSHAGREPLHAEFQTTAKSEVPVPLRMLDYYVGLKRKQPEQRIRQVLIVLTPVAGEIPDRYVDEGTLHTYDVIEMWKLDPRVLLKYEGLLPLATLCRTESGEKLLTEVAARVNRIKSRARRREVLNEARVFAGLRYDKGLVNRILKESDMLEESVIYQDIMQRGEPRGALKLLLMLLEYRFGKLPSQTRRQVEGLPVTQVEELSKALLEFTDKSELRAWLKQNAALH